MFQTCYFLIYHQPLWQSLCFSPVEKDTVTVLIVRIECAVFLSVIQGHAEELGGLVKGVRPFLKSISKAKAAKLVRTLVDLFLDMEAGTGLEVIEKNNSVVDFEKL